LKFIESVTCRRRLCFVRTGDALRNAELFVQGLRLNLLLLTKNFFKILPSRMIHRRS